MPMIKCDIRDDHRLIFKKVLVFSSKKACHVSWLLWWGLRTGSWTQSGKRTQAEGAAETRNMKAVLYSRTCEQSRGPGEGNRRLGGGVSKGGAHRRGALGPWSWEQGSTWWEFIFIWKQPEHPVVLERPSDAGAVSGSGRGPPACAGESIRWMPHLQCVMCNPGSAMDGIATWEMAELGVEIRLWQWTWRRAAATALSRSSSLSWVSARMQAWRCQNRLAGWLGVSEWRRTHSRAAGAFSMWFWLLSQRNQPRNGVTVAAQVSSMMAPPLILPWTSPNLRHEGLSSMMLSMEMPPTWYAKYIPKITNPAL